MALFKVSKGTSQNLPSTLTDGYCWYTYDDSKFYIDYINENGDLTRKALNAQDAETLTGASLATILNSSDVEIPTSKAVLDALSSATANLQTKINCGDTLPETGNDGDVFIKINIYSIALIIIYYIFIIITCIYIYTFCLYITIIY